MILTPKNSPAFLVAISAMILTALLATWSARKLDPPPSAAPPVAASPPEGFVHSADAHSASEPHMEEQQVEGTFASASPRAEPPRLESMLPFGPEVRLPASTLSLVQAPPSATPPSPPATAEVRQPWKAAQKAREAARDRIGRAQAWLASTQAEDGGWSIEPAAAASKRAKGAAAAEEAPYLGRSGATALAVLCLLPPPEERDGRKPSSALAKGITYLKHAQSAGAEGKGDLRGEGGTTLDHALATAALAEAYAALRDESLARPAQEAVDLLQKGQDESGGWRLRPEAPADLGTTAAALHAIRAAHLAYLKLESKRVARAIQFLDRLQSEDCAAYGFVAAGNDPAASAIGLLCRVHLGWKRDDPKVAAGAARMAKQGWSESDPLANYVATLYLHQVGDFVANRDWERAASDRLLRSQVEGATPETPEAGSWNPPAGPFGEAGGRHLQTCLSCLTLAAILSPLPIDRRAVSDDF